MIDINYSLRIAYMSALSGIGCPVYYQSIPADTNPSEYIVFRSISSNDMSTQSTSDTLTTVTVEIHTYGEISNSGLRADLLAREVYNRIYPFKNYVLVLDGAQMVWTNVANDVCNDIQMQNSRQYLNRFITFRHNIFQRSDIS